jgi:hypothetical protein
LTVVADPVESDDAERSVEIAIAALGCAGAVAVRNGRLERSLRHDAQGYIVSNRAILSNQPT